jgi:predicted dehydrogenase
MHSILIIGCGSIGERHLRCFQKTGRCTVAACDTNAALRAAMKERYAVPAYESMEAAFAAGRFDGVVICTPAHLHLPQAVEILDLGMPLLIEKPLATDMTAVPEVREAIARAGKFVGVAYVYHFMPWVAGGRACLRSGELGRPLHVSCTAGQHFPSFRPAYREIYYTRHEQGGGAIQDALTHVVNGVEWIIGPCTQVFCDASHQALEGVTVEDTVNATARHGGILVSYALSQFQTPNENTMLFNCGHGSLKIEFHHQRWGTLRLGDKDWTWTDARINERDDMFTAQANAFLDGIDGKPTSLSTFEEAVQTLKFNQAALQSARTGQVVPVD